jgi:MoxR-like ATPase
LTRDNVTFDWMRRLIRPVVKVAEGVSFIASANIGNEYTATRQLDRALVDRFTIIEMDTLTQSEETKTPSNDVPIR